MSRHVTAMTIYDVDHYDDEERARIIDSYPAHEREARAKGIPTMGSGKVFPVVESSITVPAFEIPKHWRRINGLDFGWDHPFAATSLAWDVDNDTTYVTAAYRQKEAVPAIHAAAIRPWGAWIPCAWPHDGLQHDKGSGDQLATQYRAAGLNMLDEQASHAEGGNGVEAGILDMLEAMMTGRFKVFGHLHDWFEEFRLYHRKDGKLVKLRDDLLSSTRYAKMMLRFAITEPTASVRRPTRIGMHA
jgi:Terminase RNaseH-like domain/Terminase large subunit, T4likevirus-type, N-terminal